MAGKSADKEQWIYEKLSATLLNIKKEAHQSDKMTREGLLQILQRYKFLSQKFKRHLELYFSLHPEDLYDDEVYQKWNSARIGN